MSTRPHFLLAYDATHDVVNHMFWLNQKLMCVLSRREELDESMYLVIPVQYIVLQTLQVVHRDVVIPLTLLQAPHLILVSSLKEVCRRASDVCSVVQ